MAEAERPANASRDQRVRYILLAIEAETLSGQSASPYIRDSCLRLAQFWMTRAAEIENGTRALEKFRAPDRDTLQRDEEHFPEREVEEWRAAGSGVPAHGAPGHRS